MSFGKALTQALSGTKTLGPAALARLGGAAGSAVDTAASLAAQAAASKAGAQAAGVDGGIDEVRTEFSDVRPTTRAWAAGGGGVARSLEELVPGGRIPTLRGDAFAAWREQLTRADRERVWAVPAHRDAIAARLRRSGGAPADFLE